jgi:hypothetical protein
MKRFFHGNVDRRFAVAALGGWALMAPASAAPPTVTPSPGYDARLQEQRAAPVIVVPARAGFRAGDPAPRQTSSRRALKYI